jgi:hypothetical protein
MGRAIDEFTHLVRALLDERPYGNEVERAVEIIRYFDEHVESLIKNDRQSLILLQRLQESVGHLLQESPAWVHHHGLMDACVRISPSPVMLSSAVSLGLFGLMLSGESNPERLSLGAQAVRLGGIFAGELKITDNGYGLTKDHSPAFVAIGTSDLRKQRDAVIATDFLSGLFHNTLKYSYILSERRVEHNLMQLLAGLVYFGGEPGCRLVPSLIPSYLSHRPPMSDEEIAEPEFERVTRVLSEIYRDTQSSNALHILKEHDYQAYVKHFEPFEMTYAIGNKLRADARDFDFTVLPVESAELKESVLRDVNGIFCGDSKVNLDRAKRLIKVLIHFELRGKALRRASTNSHVSNVLQWGLDAIIAGLIGKEVLKVKPRDVVAQVVAFGAKAPALFATHMESNTHTYESLLAFLKEESLDVSRNGLVLGLAFKDVGVKATLEDRDAMDFIGSASLYRFGVDMAAEHGLVRDSFSELDLVAIAGFIQNCFDRRKIADSQKKYTRVEIDDGLRESLERCASHPRTRESMSIMPPDAIENFMAVFPQWFTKSYRDGIKWNDHRIKARILENDLGM